MDEKKYQNHFVKLVQGKCGDDSNEILDLIVPVGDLCNSKVIEVYSNDYQFRLIDALKSNFESLWMLLGDDEFQNLAVGYIKSYPSSFYDLNVYGHKMSVFILDNYSEMPSALMFSELALFEINFWKVFHSQNSRKKSIEDFSQDAIVNSTLNFNDSLILLNFQNDVFAIFSHREKCFEEFERLVTLDEISKPVKYLLFKRNGRVFCKSLSQIQYDFFFEIYNSKISLAESLERSIFTVEDASEIFSFIGENLLGYLNEAKSE